MGKRILVVDDDEINLKRAEFILKKGDYDVIKVESGMDCLNYLKEERVDLILLDIEMPIMSGVKTFEIIKENYRFANIPIIFLTAKSDSETVIEVAKLGAVDYLKKPFFPQDLLNRVGKALCKNS